MVSAALAAALFLIVLLLIEGWRLSPIVAALAVSVMPIAAILGPPRPSWSPTPAPAPPPGRSSSRVASPAWPSSRGR